jgi:hypothetical protein
MSIAANCEVVVVSPPIVFDALRIMEKFGYGFYDSQIIAAALACGASVLYSEDLHHGQTVDGKLSIRSPFRLRAEQRAKPYRATKRRHAARAASHVDQPSSDHSTCTPVSRTMRP